MQFRRLNAYAAECNSVSPWIMNIHLSRSFYALFFFFPSLFPLYFGSQGLGVCKCGSVVLSRTCFVFQLPADSSLSNPPWPIYKLHVRAPRGISQALLLVGSLVQPRPWHAIITRGEVGSVLLSAIINVNFFVNPPPLPNPPLMNKLVGFPSGV